MLRLGIIGMSEGNGHPYSWPAILNGYNKHLLRGCEFPSISKYLENQKYPDDFIVGAKVTHIWTQNYDLSKKIARSVNIENCVDDFQDMVNNIDALLLARDDAENHQKYAEPFLGAGIPVYIDKPLALTVSKVNDLYSKQQYPGQIFSCSALRYAEELIIPPMQLSEFGEIQQIFAFVPKSWEKYAVHVIEPILMQFTAFLQPKNVSVANCGIGKMVTYRYEDKNLLLNIFASGCENSPIQFRVMGTKKYQDFFFQDSFFAFKTALENFLKSVKMRRQLINPSFTKQVVRMIELGMK